MVDVKLREKYNLTFEIYYAVFSGNMTLEHIDIDHIAKLCRLALTDEEQKTLPGQLDTMLAHLQQLKEVDVNGVEPTLHPFEESNVLRTDDPGENFSVETALMNAPEQKNNQIVVPRIVE
ncbi:MAG: Asp-tRNA(Asn)/Glu-tRNA(Gln) amidotransferase subunit GatC [Puniceicoccales bacterium]|nr:Asp-tRNA(Asn)/Glu-tRNA(Gln) amidotransferase subunit GatC [Puniceicoccales bacterium]